MRRLAICRECPKLLVALTGDCVDLMCAFSLMDNGKFDRGMTFSEVQAKNPSTDVEALIRRTDPLEVEDFEDRDRSAECPSRNTYSTIEKLREL